MRGEVFQSRHGSQIDLSLFQSTRPMRGEVEAVAEALAVISISIHSPHAGRGVRHGCHCSIEHDFNPLAPCGARFVSSKQPSQPPPISIHSPHAGRGVF